jgi:hypothetical protein
MVSEMRTLKKDLVVHGEVEKELAKRSHFCQKVIDKYKVQIKEFKEELEWSKTNEDASMMEDGNGEKIKGNL